MQPLMHKYDQHFHANHEPTLTDLHTPKKPTNLSVTNKVQRLPQVQKLYKNNYKSLSQWINVQTVTVKPPTKSIYVDHNLSPKIHYV